MTLIRVPEYSWMGSRIIEAIGSVVMYTKKGVVQHMFAIITSSDKHMPVPLSVPLQLVCISRMGCPDG